MGNLKIGMIIGDINPRKLGGAEVYVVEVMKRLAGCGYEIHGFVGENTDIKNIFNQKNVIFHPINYPKIRNLKGLTYIAYATRKISKYLKHNHLDILHAKQANPQGVIGVRLSKKFHIPLVTTVQNPLAYKEELVLALPFKVNRDVVTKIQCIQKPLAIFVLRYSTVVAAVSNYSLFHCKKMGAKNCILVPNGVDTNVFYPQMIQKEEENNRVFNIVSTSALIPRNGLDILIKAFGFLTKDLPNSKLTIAGEGPLETDLKQLAIDFGIDDKVNFTGMIPHEKVPELLRSADLFARPCVAEGFGVSFIEAMASGVPVIACPSGGVVDFIKNYETGILVQPNNSRALSDAMLKIQKNRDLYHKIRKNALQIAKEEFSWDKITAKIIIVYHSLVKKDHNR